MSRPVASHCLRGHVIADVGRLPNGTCRRCAADKNRGYQVNKRAKRGTATRDPLDRAYVSVVPLRIALDAVWMDLTPVERNYFSTLTRRHGRISLGKADEWACRIGRHPAEIWGADWYRPVDVHGKPIDDEDVA